MTKQTAELHPPKDNITHLVIAFDPDSDGYFFYGHTSKDAPADIELWFMTEDEALQHAASEFATSPNSWEKDGTSDDDTPTRDVNGAPLQNGDDVTLIKDLPVKGAGVTIKRGTTVKNITLTNNPEEIDCKTKEVKNLVLKSCFVKKL